MKITLAPGKRERRNIPMEIPAGDLPAGAGYRLEPGSIPAQVVDGKLLFVLERVKKGAAPALSVERSGGDGAGIMAVSGAVDSLSFTHRGALLAAYHFGERSEFPAPVKPYFYPLNLGGLCITRHVPRKGEKPAEVDHPHHTSLYVAHGLVNGHDLWLDRVYPDWKNTHGYQRHSRFDWKTEGPVCAGFSEALAWQSPKSEDILDEERTFLLWKPFANGNLMDLRVTLKTTHGPVTLGDTKEGGICALRVREPLQGDATGTITNANGGTGEAECWGQRAAWCDYSGTLEGKKVGAAVLDHPAGFRFPTNWHVRDYGLFAANPFGWHDYGSGWSNDGSHTIPAGGSITFRYRIFLHKGDARTAKVQERWLDFAFPPAAEITA